MWEVEKQNRCVSGVLVLLAHVYKMKHINIQSAFKNICERMSRCDVKGCHHCNKWVCEMSSLLDIPRSSDIIAVEATHSNSAVK